MRTRIGLALTNAMRTLGITQTELAEKADTSQSTINTIICTTTRVHPDTLKKITHALDSNTNASLLIAHLEDEIERAGHKTINYDIRRNTAKYNADVEHAIAYVVSRVNYDHDLAQLIIDLVAMLENGRIPEASAAAEEKEKYGSRQA